MHRQRLRQKECHDYVGGRLIWEEIKAAHPEIVRPLRKTEQGWEYYLVSTVDTALKAAQLSASLIHRCLACSCRALRGITMSCGTFSVMSTKTVPHVMVG